MLPESLQQRLLTELVYGKEVETDLRKLSEPYRLAFRVIRQASPAERLDLLFDLGGLDDKLREVVQQVQGISFEKDLADYDEDWAEAEIHEPPVEWLWPGWLPRRHVSLLVSYGGVGKSAVILDWVAHWLTGRSMPDGHPLNRQGEAIIFCDGEDFFQEYAARTRTWQAAGLWPKTERTGIYLHRRLHKSKEHRLSRHPKKWQLIDFADPYEQDRLISLVYRRKPEWLIIDSVTSTFADTTFDKDIREPLGFITAMTDEYNLATTLIHHYNKAQRLDMPPDVSNVKGAGAFINFCRSNFTLHYEKTIDPTKVDRKRDPRILSPLKTNFAIPDPIGVWFKPLHPAGFFIDYCPADEIYAMAAELRQAEAEEKETLVQECSEWLQVELAKGPASRRELIERGDYKPFIIDQAKKLLGDQVGDTLGRRKTGNKWQLTDGHNNDQN